MEVTQRVIILQRVCQSYAQEEIAISAWAKRKANLNASMRRLASIVSIVGFPKVILIALCLCLDHAYRMHL